MKKKVGKKVVILDFGKAFILCSSMVWKVFYFNLAFLLICLFRYNKLDTAKPIQPNV